MQQWSASNLKPSQRNSLPSRHQHTVCQYIRGVFGCYLAQTCHYWRSFYQIVRGFFWWLTAHSLVCSLMMYFFKHVFRGGGIQIKRSDLNLIIECDNSIVLQFLALKGCSHSHWIWGGYVVYIPLYCHAIVFAYLVYCFFVF